MKTRRIVRFARTHLPFFLVPFLGSPFLPLPFVPFRPLAILSEGKARRKRKINRKHFILSLFMV